MNNDSTNDKSSKKNRLIFGKEIKASYIWAAVLLPLIVSISANHIYDGFKNIKENINKILNLPNEFDELQASIIGNNDNFLEKFESVEDRFTDLERRLTVLENDLSSNSSNSQNVDINIHVGSVLQSTKDKSITISTSKEIASLPVKPTWSGSDIIATDKNGVEFTANDLVNQKVLLPSKVGNIENYFYGQFNENNEWNGTCITTTYENDYLASITESEYNNGILLSYKQVIKYTTQSGIDVWGFSDRKCNGKYNSGTSWNYVRSEEYKKQFNIDNVEVNDIFNVEQFEIYISNQTNSWLEGYYYGNTSDGSYNDTTGEAYLVKYYSNNTIRTFYSGKFVDGNFNDLSGNAWYITRDEEKNTDYMYYKGHFQKGRTLNNSGSVFENNLTIDRINEIIKEHNFDFDFNWYKPVET